MAVLTLLPDPSVRASLDMDAAVAAGGLATTNVDTIIEAWKPGAEGERVKIVLVAGGASATVTCAATYPNGSTGDVTLTFTFKTAVSTVADFEAALILAPCVGLVRIKTAGTGANVMAVTVDEKTGNLIVQGVTSSAVPTLTSQTAGFAIPHACDQATILTHSTAGSGTMTATIRMWGFYPASNRWYALGTATTGIQGYLNAGVAMAEVSTAADKIAQAEVITGLRGCSRLYAEIVGTPGGSTAVVVRAVCAHADTTTH